MNSLTIMSEHWINTLSDFCAGNPRHPFFSLVSLRGNFPPALLLSGPPSIGKTTIALWTIRSQLCEREHICSLDNYCSSCRALRNDVHPDLLMITATDRQQSISIEQSRRVIEFFSVRSWSGLARWALIVDADHLTIEAGNALLKLIEELPYHSHLLLTSSTLQRLPSTIRSRIPRVHLPRVSLDVLRLWMERHSIPNTNDQRLSAHGCPGILRTSRKFINLADRRTPLTVQVRHCSGILRSNEVQKDPQRASSAIEALQDWYQQLLEEHASESIAHITASLRLLERTRTALHYHGSISPLLYECSTQLEQLAAG